MIGPGDDVLDRIVESLAELNVNLEGVRVSLVGLQETRVDHEQRLRAMERWKCHLTPVLAAVTFLLGAVAAALLEWVFGTGTAT